ncbi:MAG: HU family DNA-binding protein [Syntrophorhabdales bacterium]
MNKADLIDAMAKAGEIKKAQAEKSLSALTDAIKAGLAKGERAVLPGIGSFSCVQKKARTGRNPRTGKEISIPARASVKFSPAAALKEQMNPVKK